MDYRKVEEIRLAECVSLKKNKCMAKCKEIVSKTLKFIYVMQFVAFPCSSSRIFLMIAFFYSNTRPSDAETLIS